jgi:AcrR family transcriptional regulator
MPRPRAATYDSQRDLILARAAELFARRGYTAATMNDVAAACKVSKATLYHYVRDKHALLAQIAETHVARLETLVVGIAARRMKPEARVRALIVSFMHAYAHAQHEHRVLTEDVKFLRDADRKRVLDAQRRVVAAFAQAVAALRPAAAKAQLDKPLALLLFGMMNWTFTWLKPDGALTHETLAPVVADLFVAGVATVKPVGLRNNAA